MSQKTIPKAHTPCPADLSLRKRLGHFGSKCACAARQGRSGPRAARSRAVSEGSASGPAERLRLLNSRQDAFLLPSSFPPSSPAPPLSASCARPVGVGGGVEAGRGRVSREGRSEPESVVLRRSEGGKMADRFSRFNEDRDFQVNTGVSEDPRRARGEPGVAFLPASRLSVPLRSAPPCTPAPLSAAGFSRGLRARDEAASPASPPFASPLPRGLPPSWPWLWAPRLGALLGLSFAWLGGLCRRRTGPRDRAGLGKAWGQWFPGQGFRTLGFCSPRSSWEFSLLFSSL